MSGNQSLPCYVWELVSYCMAMSGNQSARDDIQRLHEERKQLLTACDELSSKRDLAADEQERVRKPQINNGWRGA